MTVSDYTVRVCVCFSAIQGNKIDGTGGGRVPLRAYVSMWWEAAVFETRLW